MHFYGTPLVEVPQIQQFFQQEAIQAQLCGQEDVLCQLACACFHAGHAWYCIRQISWTMVDPDFHLLNLLVPNLLPQDVAHKSPPLPSIC